MPTQDGEDEFEFDRAFGWLMHDVQRLIRRNWARGLKASGLGLSDAQARVLVNLERQDGALTQTQLANEVEMEKAPLGRLLDSLEERGYLTREQDPEDRRARRVSISEKGLAAMPAMRNAAHQIFAEALKDVPAAKIDAMLDVLGSMRANLSPFDLEDGAVTSKSGSEAAE